MSAAPKNPAVGRLDTAESPRSGEPGPSRPSVAAALAGLAVTCLAVGLLFPGWLDWTTWPTVVNPAEVEAAAWWRGELHLPRRLFDTAFVPDRGRAYNVYPPLQTLVLFLLRTPAALRGGAAMLSPPLIGAALLAPLVIITYGAFLVLTRRVVWTVILATGWLAGSAVAAAVEFGRHGSIYHVNHVLSQIGLLLMAAALLKGRLLPALAGLCIAAWTRQLAVLYAPMLIWVAWRGEPSERAKRMALVLTGLLAIVAIPMALNAAKFGSPFDSGYLRMYEGRVDPIATNARTHGLFSWRFIGRNAYHMNLAPPSVGQREGHWVVGGSPKGASIWLTTPLLGVCWATLRGGWPDSARRGLMLCSLAVVAALLCYHTTGWKQPGYYRFVLDFAPVWLAVACDRLGRPGWRWPTLAAWAYGLVYFRLLL